MNLKELDWLLKCQLIAVNECLDLYNGSHLTERFYSERNRLILLINQIRYLRNLKPIN